MHFKNHSISNSFIFSQTSHKLFVSLLSIFMSFYPLERCILKSIICLSFGISLVKQKRNAIGNHYEGCKQDKQNTYCYAKCLISTPFYCDQSSMRILEHVQYIPKIQLNILTSVVQVKTMMTQLHLDFIKAQAILIKVASNIEEYAQVKRKKLNDFIRLLNCSETCF